jgi:hypothetical protein
VTLRGIGLSTEHAVAASPVWLRLIDMFTGQAPAGRVSIQIERREGNQWLAAGIPYELKPNGDLAFVNLGRVPRGQAGIQREYRVTATVAQAITETAAGAPSMVFTITTWSPDAPPATPPIRQIRCYPAPDYRFGPSVPVASGTVTEQGTGAPVGRARVRVTETVLGNTLVEEVRTNDEGWFRVPLRWSSGATDIDADRSGASGSATINVPADLGSVVSITIS